MSGKVAAIGLIGALAAVGSSAAAAAYVMFFSGEDGGEGSGGSSGSGSSGGSGSGGSGGSGSSGSGSSGSGSSGSGSSGSGSSGSGSSGGSGSGSSGSGSSGSSSAVSKPKPKAPAPIVVADVPQNMRTSTSAWGKNNGGRAMMTAHDKGYLSGDLWAADSNKIGKWYQMDTGKVTKVVGVAIMGRKSGGNASWGPQYVKTFKVKYRDGVSNTWKDVDGGKTFTGNKDHTTMVKVIFKTPVNSRYIRIYPQTYNKHMSLRAGLLVTSAWDDGSSHKILSIPASKRRASSSWDNSGWHPSKGTLGSATGWHIGKGVKPVGQWYEMSLSSPTLVTGVAIQGRGDGNDKKKAWVWQWITQFTAKYKNSSGGWTNVDNGFVFSGTGDKDQITWVLFNRPVNTSAIRIYPTSWAGAPTGRFDLIGRKSGASSRESYVIQPYIL